MLQFISGVYFVFAELPEWMQSAASVFPLKWMAQGMRSVFLPEGAVVAETSGSWQLGWVALVLGGLGGGRRRAVPEDLPLDPAGRGMMRGMTPTGPAASEDSRSVWERTVLGWHLTFAAGLVVVALVLVTDAEAGAKRWWALGAILVLAVAYGVAGRSSRPPGGHVALDRLPHRPRRDDGRRDRSRRPPDDADPLRGLPPGVVLLGDVPQGGARGRPR